MRAWLLLLVLAGCAGAAESNPSALREADVLVAPEVPDEAFDACTATLLPDPELRDVVLAGVDDWNHATGCELALGYGGVPVRLVDAVSFPDGAEACSRTQRHKEDGVVVRINFVEIARDCRGGTRNAVKRELAHLFGVTTTPLLPRTEAGLALIDAATLSVVCENVTCTRFEPEVD